MELVVSRQLSDKIKAGLPISGLAFPDSLIGIPVKVYAFLAEDQWIALEDGQVVGLGGFGDHEGVKDAE